VTGLAASIHARLLNRAKARGEDFNLILTRYAIERFLYRFSLVPARETYPTFTSRADCGVREDIELTLPHFSGHGRGNPSRVFFVLK
jgi:hypothetical protein